MPGRYRPGTVPSFGVNFVTGQLPPRLVATLFACLAAVCLAAPAHAQQAAPATGASIAGSGTIRGIATTQGRTIRLPGVTVTVKDESGKVVATTVTEGDGSYRVAVPPGLKTVELSLEGFETVQVKATVVSGHEVEAAGDLDIAKVTEKLEVVQEAYAEPMAMTLGSRQSLDERAMKAPTVAGSSIDTALSMLAGVVFGPEGLSIRGGRPSQSVMLLGGADMADASVGTTRYQLPSEAVANVEVLPNPYAVEFGRFSSGVTIVNTRRGTDAWSGEINNLEPGLRAKRGKPFQVTGIKVFAPHAWFGGPLIKDRLFLAQTNHFDYRSYDIRSRPDTDRISQTVWSSFTRLDANVGPGHTATLTLGIFPERRNSVNLDTFTPPDSTYDVRQRVYNVALSDTRSLSATRVFETTAQASRYNVQVDARGDSPMVLQPQGITGSYFNRQGRLTNSLQWVASLSDFQHSWGGEHLFKAGVDVLYSSYDGESFSLPVEARRLDGTLARRITFLPAASHIEVGAADVGMFLQDRWRPASHLLLEVGARLDRDGALGRLNFTPRSGVALLLKSDGSITLRGGAGLFYERTPLVVNAFSLLEPRVEQRFASDGVTPLGPAVLFQNRVDGPLNTPSSMTWNLEYSHRLDAAWSFRTSYLERRGTHELVVDPRVDPSGTTGEMVMSSAGRSNYREAEVSARYSPNRDFEVSASYIRSHSNADLNNYAAYFGAERNPVINQNEYGPTPSDVPNRLVTRLRTMFGTKWSFASFAEIRNGFPYSAVNSYQDFVGARNEAGRLPSVVRIDLALERKIKFWKWTPWVGVKVLNALGQYTPLDVQRNIDSPFFGTFYNVIPRQLRLTLRIN